MQHVAGPEGVDDLAPRAGHRPGRPSRRRQRTGVGTGAAGHPGGPEREQGLEPSRGDPSASGSRPTRRARRRAPAARRAPASTTRRREHRDAARPRRRRQRHRHRQVVAVDEHGARRRRAACRPRRGRHGAGLDAEGAAWTPRPAPPSPGSAAPSPPAARTRRRRGRRGRRRASAQSARTTPASGARPTAVTSRHGIPSSAARERRVERGPAGLDPGGERDHLLVGRRRRAPTTWTTSTVARPHARTGMHRSVDDRRRRARPG